MKMKVTGITLVLILILAVGLVVPTATAAPEKIWYVPGDFGTIQAAIDSNDVSAGDIIMVGPGSHYGALVNKPVTIKGTEGAVIDSGPAHTSGLIMGFQLWTGSDGAVICNLAFETDLSIMNRDAVNGVIVTHCTFLNSIQAISNWGGDGWEISHNDIVDLRTRNGGGIGILIGDRSGEEVTNNIVRLNNISGTLHVWADDGGGYNGSGIVLYADFRWGMPGADNITGNQVLQNKVSLVSDNAAVVDVVAFELTDTRDDASAEPYPVIYDNTIAFNDFRGTAIQIYLTPEQLGDENCFFKNLGDNRGGGPAGFNPVGN